MKTKTIFGILIMVLAMHKSVAQGTINEEHDRRGKFLFGIKAGINLSNIYDTEGEDLNTKHKIGLAAGAFASIPLGKLFGVQPEVLFSQKGYQGNGTALGSSYQYSRTSSFLDVPVYLSFKPFTKVTFLAGPQLSFLLRQTDSFRSSSVSIQQQQTFYNQDVRKNLFCLIGGLDLNFNHLVVGGRLGFDVQSNNGDGTYSEPRYKNAWFQATVGYRF